VSMFHPVAAVAAAHVADEKRRGMSMALFSSGGSVGVTLAPLAVLLIVRVLGERYLPIIALPAVIMGAYFIRQKDIVVSNHEGHTLKELFESLGGHGKELTVLWFVAQCRAVVYVLLGSFLPMLVIARGSSWDVGTYFLSASLLAGMFGLIIGGYLSDIYDRKKLMAITMLAASPLFYAFLHTSGVLSTVLLLTGMFILSSTISVNIVMAQRTAPRLAGMASSLVMGVSFMMGALMAFPFGALADRIGIEAAMNVVFVMPCLGGIAVFFLRKE